MAVLLKRLRSLGRFDEFLAGTALAMMTLIPLIEITLRPLLGAGVEIRFLPFVAGHSTTGHLQRLRDGTKSPHQVIEE